MYRSCLLCVVIAFSSPVPVRKAMTIAAACEPTASTVETPVVVVQHRKAGPHASLVESLASYCALPVVEPTDKARILPGHVYVAPADYHLLVERDAFVITWLNRLPAPRIDFPEAPGIASETRRHYRGLGIDTLAFDLTTDLGIPVVMAAAIDRSGEIPAVTVGLGCNLQPATALDRAVMEVAQVRVGSVPRYRSTQAPPLPRRYEDVRTLEDHAAFAASNEYLGEFDFLLDGAQSRALADLPDQSRGTVEANLALCRERLETAGCSEC